jgi:GTPase Era involved in 16S rRNA processing
MFPKHRALQHSRGGQKHSKVTVPITVQLILLDTPGLVDHKRNVLETKMMSAVKSAMKDADSIVALVDVTKDREDLLAMLQPPQGRKRPPMLVALNKIDLLKQSEAKDVVVCSTSSQMNRQALCGKAAQWSRASPTSSCFTIDKNKASGKA